MSQCGEAPEFKVWAWTQKHNGAAHAETSFHPLRRPTGGRQSGPHGEIFGPRVHKLISFPRHLKVILSASAGAAGAVKVAGKRGGGGGFGSC